jgi:hypothetical protein
MRVNIRWRSGHRAGRARLFETAGSPATHRLSWPNAFASHNGSRPDRVELRPGSCGLGETRPTRAAASRYQKSCAPSVSDGQCWGNLYRPHPNSDDYLLRLFRAGRVYCNATQAKAWAMFPRPFRPKPASKSVSFRPGGEPEPAPEIVSGPLLPDRRKSDSIKWQMYGNKAVVPMWKAEMDFHSPPLHTISKLSVTAGAP